VKRNADTRLTKQSWKGQITDAKDTGNTKEEQAPKNKEQGELPQEGNTGKKAGTEPEVDWSRAEKQILGFSPTQDTPFTYAGISATAPSPMYRCSSESI